MKSAKSNGVDFQIVVGGAAGQGLQVIETLLTNLFRRAGYYVHATKEFMSRIRGGCNSITIRVSASTVDAFREQIDIALLLTPGALDWLAHRLNGKTVIIADSQSLKEAALTIDLPLTAEQDKIGGKIYGNAFSCGFVAGHLGLDRDLLTQSFQDVFSGEDIELVEKNHQAANLGFELGKRSPSAYALKAHDLSPGQELKRFFLSGTQALSLGALAGGCNFISSYPMSPSTGVLQFLATYAEQLGVVVEQAEDEISAINMGLGSWYAGGRAMVTTSGGGFALMGEGLSLAGAIESPMVIHLAQRPGPATGLPTRTEQGDLELTLYSGHGEFPRFILAPGNLEECFYCACRAFEIADRFQIPVFLLTDQYLLDSSCEIDKLPFPSEVVSNLIIKTEFDYQRFKITDDGISPRGVPGFGNGFVCVDSDEHDESGLITEMSSIRNAMVEKRMQKQNEVRKTSLFGAELFGCEDYDNLIIGWGATRNIIREALEMTKPSRTAFLYSPQVYPLSEAYIEYVRQARHVIVVENNFTGQFGGILQRETGIGPHDSWLKYDGRPFSVEEIVKRLEKDLRV